jgi:hypothetical protein
MECPGPECSPMPHLARIHTMDYSLYKFLSLGSLHRTVIHEPGTHPFLKSYLTQPGVVERLNDETVNWSSNVTVRIGADVMRCSRDPRPWRHRAGYRQRGGAGATDPGYTVPRLYLRMARIRIWIWSVLRSLCGGVLLPGTLLLLIGSLTICSQ